MTDHPEAPDAGGANRRPIASRASPRIGALAAWLARTRVTPNQISALSALVAAAGAAVLVAWPHPVAWIVAAVAVQLRLLCNLLDGMVAIEGGKTSPLGALYNEFPDRIADTLFLVAAGYACGWPELGWAAALAAALTAYIRVFGGSLGLPQDFAGFMAKQRRMALLTTGLLAQCVERLAFGPGWYALAGSLVLITLGSLATCLGRTLRMARSLRS